MSSFVVLVGVQFYILFIIQGNFVIADGKTSLDTSKRQVVDQCGDGKSDPLDTMMHWKDACYDFDGNSYKDGDFLMSCCGCFKFICSNKTKEDPPCDDQYGWNKVLEVTCCEDCHGQVFPAGSVINEQKLEDKCSTTVTTKCVLASGENKATIDESLSFEKCCSNSSGVYPLNTSMLVPAMCSVRACSRPSGRHEASWTLTKKTSGCDCCQYRGKLIADKDWVIIGTGQNATCCEGTLLVSIDDEDVSSTTSEDTGITQVVENSTTPVDCKWSPWEDVGECSTNICGTEGTLQTTRMVQTQAQHGGAICEGGYTGARTCSVECGVALIVGGFGGNKKKVELWGINNSCNRELPDTVLDRYATSTDYFDGRVLTCGGSITGNSWTSCYYMDFSTETWKFHSTLRKKRYYHSSVSVGNALYLISSLETSGRHTTEYLSEGSSTWTDGPALHDVSYGSCTVRTSNSTFVVLGGGNSKRKAREYNVATKSWRHLPDLLGDRYFFGCAMVDVRAPGKQHVTGILVAGGIPPSQQTAEFMNMATQTWVKTTNLNYNHQDGVMADLGGRYFIFGGEYTKKIEEFDPWTMKWKTGFPDMKKQRDQYPGITTIPAGKIENCEA